MSERFVTAYTARGPETRAPRRLIVVGVDAAFPDGAHYDAASYMELGQRFADAMLEALGPAPVPLVRLASVDTLEDE